MNKIILFFLISHLLAFSQNKSNNSIKFQPDISLALVTKYYFGNNYLAQGHKNQSIGFEIKSSMLHYKNFDLGIGLDKSTQKVTDYSIGGNSDKTNSFSAYLLLGYAIKMKSKFIISPELSIGSIELRQKNGSKFYGSQNGQRYGLGISVNYLLKEQLSIYTNFGYSIYNLNTKTTEAYIDYFNNAKLLSLSLGVKFF